MNGLVPCSATLGGQWYFADRNLLHLGTYIYHFKFHVFWDLDDFNFDFFKVVLGALGLIGMFVWGVKLSRKNHVIEQLVDWIRIIVLTKPSLTI